MCDVRHEGSAPVSDDHVRKPHAVQPRGRAGEVRRSGLGGQRVVEVAVTDGFVEFVVDQLAGCGPIAAKRMFGGVGLYAGDLFFGLLAHDLVYFKVDESNRGDFAAAGMGPFRPFPDRSGTMQYYEVTVTVREDAGELVRWARKAIVVASHARPRARRPSATRPPRRRKPPAEGRKRR